jgi:hypothetical protein
MICWDKTRSNTFTPRILRKPQRLFEVKKDGNTEPYHFRLQRSDGSPVSVHVQGTALRNAHGVFTGFVGTFKVE